MALAGRVDWHVRITSTRFSSSAGKNLDVPLLFILIVRLSGNQPPPIL